LVWLVRGSTVKGEDVKGIPIVDAALYLAADVVAIKENPASGLGSKDLQRQIRRGDVLRARHSLHEALVREFAESTAGALRTDIV
jgi:hypothetical protein